MKYFRATVIAIVAFVIYALTGLAARADDEEFSREQLFSVIRNVIPGVDLFALPSKFVFPDSAQDKSTFGVDFSHHIEDACECSIDWKSVAAAKVRFVYLKLTQGTGYKDPTADRNIESIAKIDGLLQGAYHFLTSSDASDRQAKFFIDKIKPHLATLALPPSLDLEWDAGPMRNDCPSDAVIKIRKNKYEIVLKCDKWAFVKSSDIIASVNIWIDTVSASTHRKPILYTSAAWWQPRIGSKDHAKEIHAEIYWIADYSKDGHATENPALPTGAALSLWQFTDGARIENNGKSVFMDASIFQGSLDEFKAKFLADQ